jgi:dihydroflavonol-4-reductase
MDMKSIFRALSNVSGIKAPERAVPLFMLRVIAFAYECYYRVTKKPVLISTSTVKLIEQEQGRTHFSHSKSSSELKCAFRPVSETLTDTLDWYRNNNYIKLN